MPEETVSTIQQAATPPIASQVAPPPPTAAGYSRTLADILRERNLIDPSVLREAEETAVKNKALLEDALIAMKVIDGETLAKTSGEAHGMPYIDLLEKKIPFAVLSKFPEEVARKYNMVVFETVGDQMIKVAVSKPWDPVTKRAFDFIKSKNHITVDPYATSQSQLETIFKQYKDPVLEQKATGDKTKTFVQSQVAQSTTSSGAPAAVAQPSKGTKETPKSKDPLEAGEISNELALLVDEEIESASQMQELIHNSAVPRSVAGIIKFAIAMKASDIHIEPNEASPTRVRYRIDGVLRNIASIPREDHPAVVSRVKIMGKLKIDEQRVPQDGRIDVTFGDREIDLRLSTFPTINGEKIVMRILDKSGGVIKMEQLGLTGRSFTKLTEAIKIPHGILLVTGPTGSGKSTTLYAAIASINSAGVNIVTLEDPIEYQINGISQSQVKPYIGYTFANGLRAILRQDPNIIMVGEIRDKETAEMAVQSALTGHLVLSTLHTNDAAGAIPRLIDMGVEPFLISSSLHTIVGQRLVRKICPDCKKAVKPTAAIAEDLQKEFASIPEEYKKDITFDGSTIYQGAGCSKCGNVGYKGRIGIYEILVVSEAVQQLTIKRSSSTDLLNQALQEGMITMKQDGVLKVVQGITSMEEVYRVTSI